MVQELLSEIEAFLTRTGMNEGTFGRRIGDRHIVRQLREGRKMWPETVESVRERMRHLEIKLADAA